MIHEQVAGPNNLIGEIKRSKFQDWLFAIYIFLLPVQVYLNPTLRLAPSDFFLFLMLAGTLMGVVKLRCVRSAWSFWHLGMLLVILFSSLIGLMELGFLTRVTLVNKDIGFVVLLATYAVITSEAYSWSRIRWILWLLVVSTVVQNLVSVAGFVAARTIGFNIPGANFYEPRLTGFLVDPNAYGGLLVLALSIHLLTYHGKTPIISGWRGELATISLGAGIILTYSRSAWIGCVLLLLLTTILRPRACFRLIGTCLLAFIAVIAVLGTGYLQDIHSLTFRESQVHVRLRIIEEAIPMFWQSPIIGIGMGVYADRIQAIIHNTPLWMLTECGIIGFTIFTGFIYWFLRKGVSICKHSHINERPTMYGLLTAFIAMVGLSMGIEALYQRHWWLIMALIASLDSIVQEREKNLKVKHLE